MVIKAHKLGERYARAILSIVPNEKKETILNDLYLISRSLSKYSELRSILTSPFHRVEVKHRITSKLFGGKIDELTKKLLKKLISENKILLVDSIYHYYKKHYYNEIGRIVVRVVFAKTPSKEILEQISSIIKSKKKCRDIEFEIYEDSSLIGGFILFIEDSMIDLSIKGFLRNYAYENRN